MTPRVASLFFGCAFAVLTSHAGTATAQTPLTTERIVSGLSQPLWAGAPLGDDRIFVVEQRGQIKVVEGGVTRVFLNMAGMLATGGHQGVLGLAFHPNYAVNRYFYTVYTRVNGDTVVSRWRTLSTDRNAANPTSEQILLVQSQVGEGHDGGALAFGPHDGYLYIALGDGGALVDPNCHAQQLNSWLGKILRIDVDNGLPYTVPAGNPYTGVPGALPEIYHYGVRQPWRMSFDRATGDLYIGDVGHGNREEINFADASESALNFGWKVFEGTACHSLSGCPGGTPDCATLAASPSYRPPIYELFQSAPSNPRSIICGFVYRGCAIPDLVGNYFFADYFDNIIRSMEYDSGTGTVNNFQDRTAELAPRGGQTLRQIASFGEDGFGEILLVNHNDGEVFKLIRADASAAAATVRNGSGTNSLCYLNVSLPIIGNAWKAEIDASGHGGATFVSMQARRDAASGTFFKGSEILVGGPSYYKTTLPSSGTVDGFELSIPCDVSLNGAIARTQAFILGGTGLELCNAIDLTVGYY